MVTLWTRLLMGLVFVFVTISSPLHAQNIPPHTPATTVQTQAVTNGMEADCAMAMAVPSHASKTKSPLHTDDGCCSDGCTCPLSHCPGTEAIITQAQPTVFAIHASPVSIIGEHALYSYTVDRLKRPPRI